MTRMTYLSIGAMGFAGGIITVGSLLALSSAPRPSPPAN